MGWPRSAVHIMKATIEEVHMQNRTLHVAWTASAEGDDQDIGELPSVIPFSWAYHEGVPCDSTSGGNRIELITETQACHTEFVVHSAELCTHPRLAPPHPKEAQVISCSAHSSTREALANRRAAASPSLA